MKVLRYGDSAFKEAWAAVSRRGLTEDAMEITMAVCGIVEDVSSRGDAGLMAQTARLDRWAPASPSELVVSADRLRQAFEGLPERLRSALRVAHDRVTAYHERQRPSPGWEGELTEGDGVTVGWRTRPYRKAGVYVPGGTAAYPSSVIMNVVPAKVAGVEQVVMVSPTPDGAIPEVAWAAAHLAGADLVVRVGGAQAIAALAFGTGIVPRCNVIVGPGNAWVAAAKRFVSGRGAVAVDMEAGPSEVLIVADAAADPEHIAADLLAQAEHDPRAIPGVILVDAPALAGAIEASISVRLATLPRAEIAAAAIQLNGFIVHAPDRAVAARLADEYAAEHLELLVERPRELLDSIDSAGAVFLGPWSPEALGDYLAGPNHVLPTAGTARFSSALSVSHFLRNTSVIEADREGLAALADDVCTLADAEGLAAHAQAVRARFED